MDGEEEEFGGLKMGSTATDDDEMLDDDMTPPEDLDFGSDDPEDNFS